MLYFAEDEFLRYRHEQILRGHDSLLQNDRHCGHPINAELDVDGAKPIVLFVHY